MVDLEVITVSFILKNMMVITYLSWHLMRVAQDLNLMLILI